MFEYMDKDMIVALSGVLLSFTLFALNLKERKKVIKGAVLIYFILIGISIISNYSTTQDNLRTFSSGYELKCNNLDQEYSVSLKKGWSIKQHYFEKDATLVKVAQCEEF